MITPNVFSPEDVTCAFNIMNNVLYDCGNIYNPQKQGENATRCATIQKQYFFYYNNKLSQ